MPEDRNLVILDFCETVINFQSADKFINFVIEKHHSFYSYLFSFIDKVFTILSIYKINHRVFKFSNLSKRICLLQIKGISQDLIKKKSIEYYRDFISKGFNKSILNILYEHKANNDIIVLVSGGYDSYLEIFQKKFDLHYLLCTKIQYRNKFATGKIEGLDCMFRNKVFLLNKLIEVENLSFNKIITYTDSITDLPLLEISNKGVVISYNESREWVKKLGYSEIILCR